MTKDTDGDRFPYPDEVELPEACSGWEEMYPRYYLFGNSEERDEMDRNRFWFWDQKETPRPLRPWDVTFVGDAIAMGFSQAQSRTFAIPPAYGWDLRIVAGYAYDAPIPVIDPEKLQEREEIFGERSQYFYGNWEELYEEEWLPGVKQLGEEIRDLEVPEKLPDYVPEETVFEVDGLYPDSIDVLSNYNRLQELALRGEQRHFEFLILTYLAYLEFQGTCEELFPDITDNAVGKMVTGLETDLYVTDTVLNDLAKLAVNLGNDVPDVLLSDAGPEEKIEQLEKTPEGQDFLDEFNDAKDPWFHITVSRGYHSEEGTWLDTLEQPFNHLKEKVATIQDGGEPERDVEGLREEREEIVEEYRSYLDGEALETFDRAHQLVLNVYSYAEDHQFWIENWLHTIIFRKLDEFGELLVAHGMLDEPRDITLFSRMDVAELLSDLVTSWSQGEGGHVPTYWKTDARERKRILEAAEEWTPPRALGEPPEEIEDPTLIMLFGITTEMVEGWRGATDEEDTSVLSGFASSSGVIEGTARVITTAAGLDDVERDEILVAPLTNPDWTPVFAKINGAVTDNGGVTSHTAIVCREYGLPAVTGTGFATTRIETGDRIRVNGEEGQVEILEKAAESSAE